MQGKVAEKIGKHLSSQNNVENESKWLNWKGKKFRDRSA